MSRGSEAVSKTLKLLETLKGRYKPGSEEVWVLAEVAKLNKLYLAYLGAVRGILEGELLREEARYEWFMKNAIEVVSALKRLNYAVYKFRRPVKHVSVDLDILIDRRDAPRAVQALVNQGFRVAVWEPYTVTLVKGGFIVDLYTEPSFAWVVYMDGGRLLRDHVEEIEVNGVQARALTREAEVVVAAAHAVYKEHMVLLMDCLTLWTWTNRGVWSLASGFRSEKALEILETVCRYVRSGQVEAPCRLKPHELAKAFLDKALNDPTFRGSALNMLQYAIRRRDFGVKVISRLVRESY